MSIIEKYNISNYQNPIIEYQGNFQTNNLIDVYPKIRPDAVNIRKPVKLKKQKENGSVSFNCEKISVSCIQKQYFRIHDAFFSRRSRPKSTTSRLVID